MSYTKINWTNSPSTPLDADNLNHMDMGIYDNAESVKNLTTKITKDESYSLMYVSETVTMLPTTTYAVSADSIALSTPVSVHITLGGGNSQLVRADGIELIDQLTNKVVDGTMSEIKITAEDVIAGLQMTEGGTLKVKYYNANCEELLNSNMGDGSAGNVTVNYNADTESLTIQSSNSNVVDYDANTETLTIRGV